MELFLKYLATLGPLGFVPFGPGTIGSLAALCCIRFIPLSLPVHIGVLIGGALLGAYAADAAEKQFGRKDSGQIIIDEFIGMYCATLMIPQSMDYLGAAFILFRFFDIYKPLLIKSLESALSGGIGVMADDLLAGLYTNLLIQGWLLFR